MIGASLVSELWQFQEIYLRLDDPRVKVKIQIFAVPLLSLLLQSPFYHRSTGWCFDCSGWWSILLACVVYVGPCLAHCGFIISLIMGIVDRLYNGLSCFFVFLSWHLETVRPFVRLLMSISGSLKILTFGVWMLSLYC